MIERERVDDDDFLFFFKERTRLKKKKKHFLSFSSTFPFFVSLFFSDRALLSPFFSFFQDAPLVRILPFRRRSRQRACCPCRRRRRPSSSSSSSSSSFPRGAGQAPQEGRGGRPPGLRLAARITGARAPGRGRLRRRHARALAGRRGARRREGRAEAGGARRVAQRAAPGGLDAGQGCVFSPLIRNRRARFFSFFRKKRRKKPDKKKRTKKNNEKTEAAIAKELAAGKTWFSAAPDSRGRPYILSPSARHARAGRDLAASRLALVYAMDAAARAADAAKARGAGDGRVVSVIDARGVGLANLDPEVSKLVVETAQVRKRKKEFFFPLSLSLFVLSHLSLSLYISLSLSLSLSRSLSLRSLSSLSSNQLSHRRNNKKSATRATTRSAP